MSYNSSKSSTYQLGICLFASFMTAICANGGNSRMFDKAEINDIFRSFAPIFGVFCGAVVGFALYGAFQHFYANTTPSLTQEIGIRLNSMLCSCIGWSYGIVIGNNMQIYGGGRFKIGRSNRLQTLSVMMGTSALYFVGTLTLLTHTYILSFPVTVIALFIYIGEIGWKKPFFMFLPRR